MSFLQLLSLAEVCLRATNEVHPRKDHVAAVAAIAAAGVAEVGEADGPAFVVEKKAVFLHGGHQTLEKKEAWRA